VRRRAQARARACAADPAERARAQLRLDNGARVRVNMFIVHDVPIAVNLPPKKPGGASPRRYQWTAVTRAQCKKGCQVRGWARGGVLERPAPDGMRERPGARGCARAAARGRACAACVRRGGGGAAVSGAAPAAREAAAHAHLR